MQMRRTPHSFSLRMEEEYENVHFLLKYYPKYYSKAEFEMPDLKIGRVRTKTKGLKVFKNLSIKDYNTSQKMQIIEHFKHQKRFIKNINIMDPALLCHFPQLSKCLLNALTLSSWKNFLLRQNIKYLTVEFSGISLFRAYDSKNLQALKYMEWHFWQHLAQLPLRSFNLHIYNKFTNDVFTFMDRLNTLHYFLSSLDSLTIFLNHLEVNVSNDLRFPHLFRYTTCLKIHEVPFATLQRVLDYIDNCENLLSLSVLKTVKSFNNDTEPVNMEFLKHFVTLQRLKLLDIALNLSSNKAVQDFLTFFTLPQSVVSVKINLCETKWTSLAPGFHNFDWKAGNLFKDNDLCVEFYNKWGGLTHLESLSLCFAEIDNDSIPSFYFVVPLLARVSTLKMLYYANWSSIEPGKKKPLDLNSFCDTIKHLKPTLKKVYVENFAISIRNMSANVADMLQLEELGLCGFILGDSNLKSLIKLFYKKSPQMVQSTRSVLEIERLVVDGNETFPECLESISQMPRNFKVSLNIDARKINPEFFVDNVCHYLPNIYSKGRAKITFSNVPELDEERFERLRALLVEHQMFKNVGLLNKDDDEEFKDFDNEGRRTFGGEFLRDNRRMGIENEDFGSGYDDDDDVSSGDDDMLFDDMSFDDKFDDIEEDF